MSINENIHRIHSNRYLAKKAFRFMMLWRLRRTVVKIIGRLRPKYLKYIYFNNHQLKDISIIGAGQFSFSALCFFLSANLGNRFNLCFDPNNRRLLSLFSFYRFRKMCYSQEQFFSQISPKDTLFITSNHASHPEYAIEALHKKVRRIYIENPIAIKKEELVRLVALKEINEAVIFSGLNRPHSPCIQFLKKQLILSELQAGITISCFVLGHRIPFDHWYDKKEEGGRIHGNLIHWIDFFIHIISWRHIPESFNITMASPANGQSNLTFTFITPFGDILNLVFSTRCEPFEGVTEKIYLQTNRTIASIDNFKKVEIWQNEKYYTKKWRKKVIGNKEAVLAPLLEQLPSRSWDEVLLSTLLAMELAEKQSNNLLQFNFDCIKELAVFRHQVLQDKANLRA